MRKLTSAFIVALVLTLAIGVLAVARGTEAKSNLQTATPTATTDKPWLGVAISELTTQIAEKLGVGDIKGVVVTMVVPQSPAAKADLRRGDVITAYNTSPITSVKGLQDAVGNSKVGDIVTLAIQRGSQSLTVQATLDKQPAPKSILAPRMRGFRLPHPSWGSILPKELQDIAPSAWFNHFMGGSANFTDKDGKPLAMTITPGVVKSTTADSITYTPNGKTDPVTITIGADVSILGAGGRKLSPTDLKAEEKIEVISVNGTLQQVRVASGNIMRPLPRGMGRSNMRGFKGMKGAQDMMGSQGGMRGFNERYQLPSGVSSDSSGAFYNLFSGTPTNGPVQ